MSARRQLGIISLHHKLDPGSGHTKQMVLLMPWLTTDDYQSPAHTR